MQITDQMENKLTANMNISKKDIILGNFLGGLSWGIGSVVGVGILVEVVGFVLNSLGVFTVIGGFFEQLNSLMSVTKQLPQVPQIYNR